MKNNRTRQWDVEGLLTIRDTKTGNFMTFPKTFCVRYTSDDIGKSLSIADEDGGVMFQVAFDEIFEEIM